MSGFGVNLIGDLTVAGSISQVAVHLALALRRHGVPLTLHDTALGLRGPEQPRLSLPADLAALRVDSPAQCVQPVNLYVCPLSHLDASTHAMRSPPGGRLHVANVWWELTELPPAYRRALQKHDAALAHTHFIANIVRTDVPGLQVVEAPLPWPVEPGRPDRDRFGLKPGATAFTFVFDARSETLRKNPLDVVRAFAAAFPATVGDVQLVIRASNLETIPGVRPGELKSELQARDPRIHVIEEPLDYAGVLSLYASSDVYVSLHRAEGFGLGMLESMAHGKAVIATAWSGNVSFMDATCAALVRTRRVVPPAPGYSYHGMEMPARALWADPLVEDAAVWMRRLHEDPSLRARFGAAARQRYERYQLEAMSSGWIDQLRALADPRTRLPLLAGRLSATGRSPSG